MIPIEAGDLAGSGRKGSVARQASSEQRATRTALMRARILRAARTLFAEMGFEAVTLRSIAAAVGCSAPALLNHFASKNDLLMAVCSDDFRTLQEALAPHIDAAADPIDRLRVIGRAYVAFAKSHPHHYRLMFMTRLPDHDNDAMGIERGNPDQDAYALVRLHVAAAMEAGYFRAELTDPDLVAQALWGAVHGVIALNETKGDDPWCAWRPLDQTSELVVQSILAGMMRSTRS